ncbi:N6-mAMP deaminase-like [Triticum dicoccoides]|uniref:N6-mAMP deaminase-like n=1 Tax=Triticum dicoccoides TaxID=85692 RepID=UPI00188FBCA5|nr:N6-mAMP deaminase-like [Triticum dicoccoides]
MGTQTSEAGKEMREWCVALPKVELHAHLNGSVRNSPSCQELAKELGDKGVIVFEDVKDVIKKSLKSVKDVDVVLNDEKLSCTPMSDLGGDAKRKKIYVRLLLSIDRHETTSAALDTVNLAMEMKDQGVIGIDLSGNPVVGEWETYLPALEHAKELGIPTTIHCGEVSEQQVPNRKEIQAMLDFCPQRLADLYNAKHPLSICTDDFGLFSTSLLLNEYYLVASTFGLSKAELFRLAQGAVEFVFAGDEVKSLIPSLVAPAYDREGTLATTAGTLPSRLLHCGRPSPAVASTGGGGGASVGVGFPSYAQVRDALAGGCS